MDLRDELQSLRRLDKNEVFVHTRSQHMVSNTVETGTSITDPCWKVDSIEVREGRKEGEGIKRKRIQRMM